ncbi:MAG TPA: hypothetical protein VH988_03560 [Thermoanaerobaculia bacterium]|jgi:hypothetical protein|nr:hypothetical protein [Thermoanaerobaculia bacterium]
MAVHIFVTSRENFEICVRHGLAAVPGGTKPDSTDQLISRMVMIRPKDRILFYLIGEKAIQGVYQALDRPFFDDAPVWPSPESGGSYPLRVRFENSDHVFRQPISLSDIYDLRDSGKIWTFNLTRPGGGANAIFSISDVEFEEILRLFLQANRNVPEPRHIQEPYRHIEPNLISRIKLDSEGRPKYESGLACLFLQALSHGAHVEMFGQYSDYLGYVPTTFQKEIDAVLFHSLPGRRHDIVAHTLVEMKRDSFGEDGLAQLLRYEDWFLKKRALGDSRAIRTVAIARSFHPNVLAYVQSRYRIEGRSVSLLAYQSVAGQLSFQELGPAPN